MTRVGNKPIPIPKGVKTELRGDSIVITGPRGELRRKLHPAVRISVEGEHLSVSVDGGNGKLNAVHGLYRALIANMVRGVSKGFERVLEIVGIGYRAELSGRTATFHLGYSHPIHFQLPEGIDAKIEKTKITLTGIDKEILGRTAAKIRGLRGPEPYKGKGIKYAEETVRRKAGKTGAK